MGVDAASLQADVAVVIPTYNHARFLGEAIKSVLAQTRQADEIIVVDDGSTDDPASVVVQFPAVRLIRQENRGPSAARNTGFRSCKARYLIFLDADDRLRPNAVEAGLNCITSHPDYALVHGGCCCVPQVGPPWTYIPSQNHGDAYLAFLSGNQSGGIMTVLFRRDCLLAVNGFDETLRRAEDYDLYLRMARKYPIGSHSEIVGEYRRHEENVSNDYVAMIRASLLVLDRHKARMATDQASRAAAREGRAKVRRYYVSKMLDAASGRWAKRHDIGMLARDLIQATRWSPLLTIRSLFGILTCLVNRLFLRSISLRQTKRDA
jgi:glycosyltransferase involved in cell wall biosynthesis